MARRGEAIQVATTRRRHEDKVYENRLPRRSCREDGKVKNETLGNLSHLPGRLVEIIRRSLKGEAVLGSAEALEVARSLAGVTSGYVKRGIRCNAMAPGWVNTPVNYAHAALLGGLEHVYATIDLFQPIGRPGDPREIANVALFLASDESSFVTGTVLVADGARTAQQAGRTCRSAPGDHAMPAFRSVRLPQQQPARSSRCTDPRRDRARRFPLRLPP